MIPLFNPDKFTSPRQEEDFDLTPLYPVSIQLHDRWHWSPPEVIRLATSFLCEKSGSSVLDIGSGSGKFCISASLLRPDVSFYGVEQRKYLVDQANVLKDMLGLVNVEFVHRNFTEVNLQHFNCFYFYNSFFENVSVGERLDDSIAYSTELYHYYSRYLSQQLKGMPAGTRIATYCSWNDEIPTEYLMTESHLDGRLKFWSKD